MGLRVYTSDAVGALVFNMGIEEIIISTSSLDAAQRKQVFAKLAHLPVKLRIVPPISDLAGGRYLVNFVRDFDIDDLLFHLVLLALCEAKRPAAGQSCPAPAAC